MAFDWAAATIGAAGNLLGGLVGASEQEDAQDEAHWQFQENLRQQREFAKSGIQWRVEDAKAAGLHPLFALGGNIPSYSPVSGVQFSGSPMGEALSRMGQDVSRAVAAQETADQRLERQMRLALLEAQIEDVRSQTDARMFGLWSQLGRERENGPGLPGVQTQPFIRGTVESRKLDDIIKPKPDEVVSRRSEDGSLTAGEHAAWREYQLTGSGAKVRLPYSEEGPGEALENIPWYMWPLVIQHNRAYYGDDWGTRVLKEMVFGNSPRYRSRGVKGGSMESSKPWFRGRSSGR